jgi:hypothetical protein
VLAECPERRGLCGGPHLDGAVVAAAEQLPGVAAECQAGDSRPMADERLSSLS